MADQEIQSNETTLSGVAVEGTAEAVTQTEPAPAPTLGPGQFFWGTGRRKTAVARVRIRPGNGKFLVNGRPVDEFFTEMQYQKDALDPLNVTQTNGKLDVYVRVNGGGPTGQAGAVRLGLARALKLYDVSTEEVLRDQGFLTRDPREVERKKYGQAGARRRFQFSKR